MNRKLLFSLCFICNISFLFGQGTQIKEEAVVQLNNKLEKPFAAAFYKDVPNGTLVLIKNPKNGKSIVVEITGLTLNNNAIIELSPAGMSRLAIDEQGKVEISYILDNNNVTNTLNVEETTNTNSLKTNNQNPFNDYTPSTENNPFNNNGTLTANPKNNINLTSTENNPNSGTLTANSFNPKKIKKKEKVMLSESKYLKEQAVCFHRTLPIGSFFEIESYLEATDTKIINKFYVVGKLQGKNVPNDVNIQITEIYFKLISNNSAKKIIEVDVNEYQNNVSPYYGYYSIISKIVNVFEEGICKPSSSKALLGNNKFALHKTAPIGTMILLEIIDGSNEDSNSNQNRRNTSIYLSENPFNANTSRIFVFEVVGKLEDTPENKNTVLVVGEQVFNNNNQLTTNNSPFNSNTYNSFGVRNYNTSEEKSLPVKVSYFEE